MLPNNVLFPLHMFRQEMLARLTSREKQRNASLNSKQIKRKERVVNGERWYESQVFISCPDWSSTILVRCQPRSLSILTPSPLSPWSRMDCASPVAYVRLLIQFVAQPRLSFASSCALIQYFAPPICLTRSKPPGNPGATRPPRSHGFCSTFIECMNAVKGRASRDAR